MIELECMEATGDSYGAIFVNPAYVCSLAPGPTPDTTEVYLPGGGVYLVRGTPRQILGLLQAHMHPDV